MKRWEEEGYWVGDGVAIVDIVVVEGVSSRLRRDLGSYTENCCNLFAKSEIQFFFSLSHNTRSNLFEIPTIIYSLVLQLTVNTSNLEDTFVIRTHSFPSK